MTTVTTNQTEASILEVIRDLEAQNRPTPTREAVERVSSADPAALHDLQLSIKNKLEFVNFVEKKKFGHLVEGSFGGKTIAEVRQDLHEALVDLEEIIRTASSR